MSPFLPAPCGSVRGTRAPEDARSTSWVTRMLGSSSTRSRWLGPTSIDRSSPAPPIGCPFLDVHVERLHQPDSWNAYCRAYTRESLHFLSSATAGTVIISNIDTYWEDPAVAIVTSNGTPSVRLSDKYAALEEGMGAMVENLESAGHDVVVVQTIPRWSEADTWRTASCTVPQILEDGCRQTMRRQDALDRQGNVRRTIADATSHTGGADPRHLGGALPGKGKPVFDTRQRPTALLPRWASRLSHRGAIPSTVVPGDS